MLHWQRDSLERTTVSIIIPESAHTLRSAFCTAALRHTTRSGHCALHFPAVFCNVALHAAHSERLHGYKTGYKLEQYAF
eukprot:SAG31_NODE_11944_length_983_cov_1.002262_1_plen_79_part_00